MDCRKYTTKYTELKKEVIDELYELMETYKVKEIDLDDYEEELDEVVFSVYDDNENGSIDRLAKIINENENGKPTIHLKFECGWSAYVEKYYCDGFYSECLFKLYEVIVECIENGYYTKSE